MAPKRDYTPLQMGKAIEAVGRGMSVAAAAKQYTVPRITLRNKVTGKSPIVSKMGPKTILTEHEEEVLVKWLIKLNERHFPVGKEVLLDSVQKIIVEQKRDNPFTDDRPGKKWFHSFMKRHPEISERTAQNLTSQRDNVTEEQIKGWFTEIDAYLKAENLSEIIKDPRRIFNADESAFFLNPKPGRVLAKKGEKHIYSQSGDEKENLTVLVCANAAGQQAPPMIVYDYERIPSYISSKVPEKWGIGRSDSGWMCSSTFYEYVANIFNPWIEKEKIPKPVIFFLDGHASHVTMHLSNFGLQNGIEIIALYPNSTHILQPMDVAVFKPLKTYWKNEIKEWKMENLGQNVKKENFAPVLKKALDKISEDCIKNGFRSSGLFPFGPDFIDMKKIRNTVKIDTGKEDPNQKQFMSYLESEIVKTYTLEKLTLFNKLYYQDANTLQDSLPNEDLSLYMIWAKNRKPHINAERIEEIPCTSAASTMSTVTQENKAPSPTTTSVPQELDQLLTKSTDGPEPALNVTYVGPHTTPLPVTDSNETEKLTLQIQMPTASNNKNLNDPVLSVECENIVPRLSTVYSVPADPIHNHDIASAQAPSRFDQSAQYKTPSKVVLNEALGINVPTPFKRNLFWPANEENKKKRRKKEKIPSAVTSKAWREYHEKKEEEKKRIQEEKEKRANERKEKKILKEKINADKKKKATIKGRYKKVVENSSSEDTECEIPYAESEDSDWAEFQQQVLAEDKNSESEDTTLKIVSRKKTLDIIKGNYVIVKYEGEYFPGKVENTDVDTFDISTMVLSTGNSFRWPERPDKIWYRKADIVEKISDPIQHNKRGFYKIKEMDKYLPDIYIS